VILCDEWTPAQVKAFRLMVNRSVEWASWDEEALALELQEIQDMDFDLSLTGFDPHEIGTLLALDDEERANAANEPRQPCSEDRTNGSGAQAGARGRNALRTCLRRRRSANRHLEDAVGSAAQEARMAEFAAVWSRAGITADNDS
jgi:ParB-like chromosome segregation protein Spo0J